MTTTDNDIKGKAIKAPEKCFRELLEKYQQPVYWHIRRLVVNHADAEDAAQETFIRVYRSLSEIRQENSLVAWIYRIATNEALRIIDNRKQEYVAFDNHLPTLNTLTADEYVDFSDLEAVKLQNAILQLSTKQQVAFNMRYYDEMDYFDIAAATNSTPTAVKANYYLAKEKIIEYMNAND